MVITLSFCFSLERKTPSRELIVVMFVSGQRDAVFSTELHNFASSIPAVVIRHFDGEKRKKEESE